MTSSIFLNELEFFGTHGAYPAEHVNKQRFLVSVEIRGPFSQAAQTDDLRDTVDYSEIYKIVQNIIETQHFKLIETLAHHIVHAILETFPIVESVTIVLKKFPTSWADKNYGSIGFRATITR